MSATVKWLLVAVGVLLVVAAGWFAVNGLADAFGGSGSRSQACEQAYTETIEAVSGVASVEVDCSLQFGGGWQRVTVSLNAASDADAAPIADELLRALAADQRLEDTWMIPRSFGLSGGDTTHEVFASLGFDRAPSSVGDLRDHYDIHPKG